MTLLEKEWYIQAPWGRLAIIAWGDCSDPPVLVCHGAKDSAASFRPLMKLLPKKYYYIGMELPGNGRSDPMPPGLMVSLYDLVYSIQVVVKHFRWDTFIFMGHSMGCSVGYIYNISYPGKMSKLIQLDPISIGFVTPVEKFSYWYKISFKAYFDNYDRYNVKKDDRPKYTREEAVSKLIKRRGFTEEAAEETLARTSEPAGHGYVRFTFDDRFEAMTYPPVSPDYIKKLLTNMKIPILTILADESIKKGRYRETQFLLDDKSFPNNNYRVREVVGHHDLHVVYPERIASFVSQFILYGFEGLDRKSKL
ncbi:serine hydrolase-like protein 2 isoform X1 [Maniola jurtina]|uniref:serine hydrolase-like protein 2 isoform X1 n=2 Tax=Maniola jurtina TaxID=191418 RepID=UPI001E689457|nr:serine hydrolase-like protein 2 isoform X1 [Maniola jurtina]